MTFFIGLLVADPFGDRMATKILPDEIGMESGLRMTFAP
jgi:hypothetical protein